MAGDAWIGNEHASPARSALGRPGMRAVAERAGVAMSSVSRVLSGHPDVSPRMHQSVMDAVRELGYQPNLLAQGLRSGKTYSVGLTVSDISNQVLAECISGAEKRLREHGYSLLLTNSDGDASLDADHISLLERRRIDGLILLLAAEDNPKTAQALLAARIPLVLIDRDVPPGVAARCAVFDHRAGMRDAVRHLVALGHREFAFIVGGPRRPARERRQAIDEVLSSVAGGANCIVHEGEFTVEYGEHATSEILLRQPRPTAIIAGGNMLMEGALRALRGADGVELGRDVSLVGCDDVAVAEFHMPPISVVRRDMRAIGIAAADLLLAEMEGRSAMADVVLPTEFLARPSCGPAPAH